MKVLQLSKKFPYPLKDGESIATSYLAKALSEQGVELTLLSMNTSKHRTDLSTLPSSFDHYRSIYTVDIDNRLRPKDALLNLLFSKESYHIIRFIDTSFSEQLVKVLLMEDFDIVHLETLFLTPYVPLIRQYSNARIVLRSHNVEHVIWERVAKNSGSLKRWYLNQITPRLKQYEVGHLNAYDLMIAISRGDLDQFERLGMVIPGLVIPIGLDSGDYHPDFGAFDGPFSISFIGSLDWMPNVEGLDWFLSEVWVPLLLPRFPQLTFHIAGRNTPARLMELRIPGVVVHGEVPSAQAFLNAHALTIAPLLSGGGMRAKILEGMALGRVVISTTVGMEGIDVEDGVEALLADTPEDWLRKIEWCFEHRSRLSEIGAAAISLCNSSYDNRSIARRLVAAYEDLLQ
jgi:glycosyltransferase involved in cell wall biosynthesis